MQRTPAEVREEGLKALMDRLGRADMIRFLQQFESGEGDYASERQDWAARITLSEIERAASGQATANGG